jgi:predicted nicotinamide N-methyase
VDILVFHGDDIKRSIIHIKEELHPSSKTRLDNPKVMILVVDISYAAPQAHEIVNVALHREYSPDIVFIFSQGRRHL